ncbi:putative membrane protein YdjX (TVP38/TMEM64 family) [Thermosporothrix hazakensis]|uniref:TVP38/TMEM64 family membrane protein n=2 Tax=Thermosporothrix TaxID=768650 RepID=A0A326U2I0_THEHA|nr:TVP38/TMEM64 family protein [Thermosporothrix hazakensis]PZW24907.1 putative membrane protein YdjX (TVP38/TMEM64 family) [Thermosporothrix hazakensis]BBH88221.1 TVP38/TMEM64 family protein [Thermosporothrix sp. COM3]GCE46407.1 TVP38/TMEM64 family protein [Thermosporothrix hazakensis]
MSKKNLFYFALTVLIVVGAALFFFLHVLPNFESYKQIFSSLDSLRAYVQSFGAWAPLIFFLIQVTQVIVSPIPGNITTLAGGALFGIVPGFLLSGSAIVVGSMLAFYLARFLGHVFVIKLVGRKQYERYNSFFTGRYSLGLLIIFLVPFFPDDVLCLLAGLSAMPASIFFLFLLIGRLPGTFLTTLVGAGVLQLSLVEWIVVGVISLLVIVVIFKYGDRFEEWMGRKIKKLNNKENGAS